jgi:hypothetical protein
MTKKNIFLYNPWTEIDHGHARSELLAVKKLLTQNNFDSSILSVAYDFGDTYLNKFIEKESSIPKILQRGPIFRLSKRNSEVRQMNALLEFLKSSSKMNTSQVIITSTRSNMLDLVDQNRFKNIEFKIRLIEPPKNQESTDKLKKILLLSNVSIAIETSDGKAAMEKIGINGIITVPPIQGLMSVGLAKLKTKVGLIWPVSFQENEKKFQILMDSISEFNGIVRLPGNYESETIREKYLGHTFIDRGISDEEFNRHISQIRIAILPHRNYELRGSGLAAILAGSGATILAHKENSFYSDIHRYSKIEDLQELLDRRAGVAHRVNEKSNEIGTNSTYREWTLKCWEEFLFDDK